MGDGALQATLTFLVHGNAKVGAERIALLEAIETLGSLSAAAKDRGLSYKAAWDAVRTMNNMLPQPVAVTRAGGRHGGETVVTPQGRRIIAAFHQLQAALGRFASHLREAGVGPDGGVPTLLEGLFMRTSARNMLKATVRGLTPCGVNVDVRLDLCGGVTLTAVVTGRSVAELGLRVGGNVIALIKSNFIELSRDAVGVTPFAGNRIGGVVLRLEDGTVNREISVDIGGGKTLTAIAGRRSAEASDLAPGVPVVCRIEPSHVILAVE